MPDTAADLLIAARRDPGKRLADLPVALRPADKAAAYEIQHQVAASFKGIGAWKVGAAGPDAPPGCGAIPADTVAASPITLSAATHPLRGIEAEISFRIGVDLPPRESPYTREEVVAAIAAAHPAIEVLESRYLDPESVSALSNLADTQMNGGFVYGPPVERWHNIDFAAETVRQYVDGALQVERVGPPPSGDMIRLVVWLANEGAVWAGGLKAGQFVTCGSWTGKETVGPTAAVRVAFARMGEVHVSYA